MLDWQKVSIGGGDDAGGYVTVDRHWYLTEDKTRVVEEGHPESRWLWASPGTQVPRRDAIRYGALKEQPVPVQEVAVADEPEPEKTAEPEAEVPAEEKQAKPAANKAAKKATNKAAKTEAEDK